MHLTSCFHLLYDTCKAIVDGFGRAAFGCFDLNDLAEFMQLKHNKAVSIKRDRTGLSADKFNGNCRACICRCMQCDEMSDLFIRIAGEAGVIIDVMQNAGNHVVVDCDIFLQIFDSFTEEIFRLVDVGIKNEAY